LAREKIPHLAVYKKCETKLRQKFIYHKSLIVSSSKMEAIENNEIIMQSHSISISRNYGEQVIKKVVKQYAMEEISLLVILLLK